MKIRHALEALGEPARQAGEFGAGGEGKSAMMLYQPFGMRDSSSRYLTVSAINVSWLFVVCAGRVAGARRAILARRRRHTNC